MPPVLPTPRGPLSAFVLDALRRAPGEAARTGPPVRAGDALGDDDLHLALYCLYELHYRGFAGVADGWEWDPGLLGFRARLEGAFEERLRDAAPARPGDGDPGAVARVIGEAIDAEDGPSLSAHLSGPGTLAELREFLVHRSAYQLKEADPHTWVLPRLDGEAKAAVVQIQADEYGNGARAAMHATLFEDTMRAAGLDPTYGAYLDALPGTTLATVNLISLLGLHRRHRGALVGHLAVFEMTSVTPMSRYARALRRHRLGLRAARFYDVHVVADAEHEVVARELVARLAADEPGLAAGIVFGARTLLAVERRFAEHLLRAWASGRSSLLLPAPVQAAAS